MRLSYDSVDNVDEKILKDILVYEIIMTIII